MNITPSNDRETLPSLKAIRAYLPGNNGLAGTKLTDDHHPVCRATIPIFRSLNMMAASRRRDLQSFESQSVDSAV
jgi:hypothetical protein